MFKAFAQTLCLPGAEGKDCLQGPLDPELNSIGAVVSRLIPLVFLFAGVALLIMILIGGMNLITSTGDPKKLQAAKDRLTWAIVGFVIVFVAFWIVQLVAIMFGISEWSFFGGIRP